MYNRYIPNGTAYTRIVEEDDPAPRPPDPPQEASPAPSQPPDPQPDSVSEPPEAKKSGLAGLLKGLKLDSLDTGDILLLLILLFLFLEGDDMELIITLALLLLLGLD